MSIWTSKSITTLGSRDVRKDGIRLWSGELCSRSKTTRVMSTIFESLTLQNKIAASP